MDSVPSPLNEFGARHREAATLRQVAEPINTARGLPNAFYTDPDVFRQERSRIFANGWPAIGFGKDVPEPGDAKPVEFLGMPLLMVRGRDGMVRVFQNVCRHRGMILIDEPRKLNGLIRCPYHSWCYELSGTLRATPHVGGPGQNVHPDVDRSKLGLIEVRSHLWMDVVFVNVSGTAPDFGSYASDLLTRFRDFEGKALHFGGEESAFQLDVGTNWKLAVENYCESYHLPWVHPGLNSYSKLEDHYHMIEQTFSGQGTIAYTPGFGPNGERFSPFPGLSEKWAKGAEYPSFFPNTLFGFQNDHVFVLIIEPVSHEQSIEHVAIYYAGSDAKSTKFDAMRQRNATLWKEIFSEDIFVVEGMQRGRRAPGFDGGKFSPAMDGPTHAFHRWVASKFLEDGPAGQN